MVARLGRVIYWPCCGVAVLLAIGPVFVHGVPLLEKPLPPLGELENVTVKVAAQTATHFTYEITLPGGTDYKVEVGRQADAAKLDLIKLAVTKMAE